MPRKCLSIFAALTVFVAVGCAGGKEKVEPAELFREFATLLYLGKSSEARDLTAENSPAYWFVRYHEDLDKARIDADQPMKNQDSNFKVRGDDVYINCPTLDSDSCSLWASGIETEKGRISNWIYQGQSLEGQIIKGGSSRDLKDGGSLEIASGYISPRGIVIEVRLVTGKVALETPTVDNVLFRDADGLEAEPLEGNSLVPAVDQLQKGASYNFSFYFANGVLPPGTLTIDLDDSGQFSFEIGD